MNRPPPAGLLLAAGRSTRMGRPKALLRWRGRTLLEHALSTLGALADPVVAVVPPGPGLTRELAARAGARLADGVPDGEMVDSLRAGLAALPAGRPVLVATIDQVLIPSVWLGWLARLAADHPETCWIPLCDGAGGHPVALSPALATALRDGAPAPDGLRGLLRAAPKLGMLETHDPACRRDLDTPAQWRAFVRATRRDA